MKPKGKKGKAKPKVQQKSTSEAPPKPKAPAKAAAQEEKVDAVVKAPVGLQEQGASKVESPVRIDSDYSSEDEAAEAAMRRA